MLDGHLNEEDNPEGQVVEKSLEYISLSVINNSAVDLVEQVHHDKCMEADGVVDKLVGWRSIFISQWSEDEVVWLIKEDEATEVHKDDHHKDLVGRLAEDGSPHSWLHDLVLLSDSLLFGAALCILSVRLSA